MADNGYYPTTMYYPDGTSKTISSPDEWEPGTQDHPFAPGAAGGERVIGQPATHEAPAGAVTHVAPTVEQPKTKGKK